MFYSKQVYQCDDDYTGYVFYDRYYLIYFPSPQYPPVVVGKYNNEELTGGKYYSLILIIFITIWISEAYMHPVAYGEAKLKTYHVEDYEIGVFQSFF